jgi:hypothetical protein
MSHLEIINNLSTKLFENGSFFIWQKDFKTGKRTIYKEIQFDSIDVKNNFFSIRILNIDILNKIKREDHFYFVLTNSNFVFKTHFISFDPTQPHILTYKIPREVLLKENREHPRLKVSSTMKATVATVFYDKFTKSQLHTVCPIDNISISGICILIASDTMKRIDLQKDVILEPVTTFPDFKNKTTAVIRNFRIFSKKSFAKDEIYALGLQFRT